MKMCTSFIIVSFVLCILRLGPNVKYAAATKFSENIISLDNVIHFLFDSLFIYVNSLLVVAYKSYRINFW